ncbi:hypothetical protein L6452_30203 [Arctium lappa]|uniref:Uncharacterized protein n=1 Tax=Arctium lappa TaxID=4217 RepID=A0ACB8ZHK3_ARCLA|nr:hypothetical protein L6452_30203 [Arctium lappa]
MATEVSFVSKPRNKKQLLPIAVAYMGGTKFQRITSFRGIIITEANNPIATTRLSCNSRCYDRYVERECDRSAGIQSERLVVQMNSGGVLPQFKETDKIARVPFVEIVKMHESKFGGRDQRQP